MDASAMDTILNWRYRIPYACYNLHKADNRNEDINYYLNPDNWFYIISILNLGLAGYCCFGEEARVPGGPVKDVCIDIGLGLAPVLVGQGLGLPYTQYVMDLAIDLFPVKNLRLSVAKFNHRAIKVYERAGFFKYSEFLRTEDGSPFVCMVCDRP